MAFEARRGGAVINEDEVFSMGTESWKKQVIPSDSLKNFSYALYTTNISLSLKYQMTTSFEKAPHPWPEGRGKWKKFDLSFVEVGFFSSQW